VSYNQVLNKKLDALQEKLRSVEPDRRAYVILLVGIVYLGALITVDQLIVREPLTEIVGPTPDVPYYRERTQTVLDGGWLYRDIRCESPPLIVYFMLPAQLLGGEDWIYEIYFSSYQILTALLFYYGLRKWDDYKAFACALLIYAVPFETVESTFGIQDESIVVFLFFLSAILALHRRFKLSAALVAIGIWTKVFSVMLYPSLFLAVKKRRERLAHLLIIVIVSIVISIPFLIVTPGEFLSFPSYYFLEGGTGPAGGDSLWGFLAMGGLSIPRSVLLITLAIALSISIYYVAKKKLGFWSGTLVIVVAFLLFYPRTAMGYYIFPILMLIVWAVENKKVAFRCFTTYVPFFAALAFSKNNVNGVPLFDYPWSWIAGFILVFIGTVMLLDTVRLALRTTPFIERNTEYEKSQISTNRKFNGSSN
jgi:hypothetical protein